MNTSENIRPTILVDTREQCPLSFKHLASVRGTLQTGDYSIVGLEEVFSVERKSVPDLVSSVIQGRDRFERELHRLRGYRFKRLLIVGSREDVERGLYESKANPRSILASLQAFEIRYDLPIVWQPDEAKAAILIETWAVFFAREVVKGYSGYLAGMEAAKDGCGTPKG